MIEDNGLDADGYIRNEVSLDKIPERFQKLVAVVQSKITNTFASQLHSLYLYGSVATGKAQPISSDLDILIVFENEPSAQIRATVKQLENELSQTFRADVREVGLAATFLAEVLEGDYHIGLQCFIKHLCVCLAGEDLGTKFPKFKPTRAVAYGLNGDIKQVLDKAKNRMPNGSQDTINSSTMSASRNMIRTAFCLVMEEANCWTTNLDCCSSIFTAYYPAHAGQLKRLLEISNGAEVRRDEFLSILNGFGTWLCNEVERKLRTPN
jgi:predicted nucleotidyltransferase